MGLVIMAYDECATLESVVADNLTTFADADIEILIVDDRSSDGTGDVADLLARRYPRVRVIHHAANQGLGGEYRTGFREARGKALTFLPADGQYPPSIARRFLDEVAAHDLILGYVERRTDALLGRVLSLSEPLLYRVLFGRMPRFQSVFMIRRSARASLPLTSEGRGWAIVMEIILRAQRAGLRIATRPTEVRPRVSGVSKVSNLSTILHNLLQLWRLRWQLRGVLRTADHRR